MKSLTTSTPTTYKYFFYIFLLCFFKQHCCSSKDNITIGETISGTEYLESQAKKFQMGFFSLGNESELRYVGIWYTMDPKTVVWVANRNDPVPDSSGVLKIAEDGELKVLDEKNEKTYFQTTTGGGTTPKVLKLHDSGNAVLTDITSGEKLWESFHSPTDTLLPGMKMEVNLILTSWKNVNDPSSGKYNFKMEETYQYVIWDNDKDTYHWKSGSGSINSFDPEPLPIGVRYLLSNSTKQPGETNYCNSNAYSKKKNLICAASAHSFVFNYSRLVMNHTGNIQYFTWAEDDKQWVLDWQVPKDDCSIYKVCGKFSVCSLSDDNNVSCNCLLGFEPILQDASAGCEQKKGSSCSVSDEFLNEIMINIENPTLPFVDFKNESDCKHRCLKKCDCVAYSYTPAKVDQIRSDREGKNNSCWIWDSDLLNLQANGKHNISIRVHSQGYFNPVKGSPTHENSSSVRTEAHILIIIMAILLILLLGSLGYIYYKRSFIREQGTNSVSQTYNSERWAIELLDLDQSREEDTESIGVPFFQLESILAATDNFADANKLGRGGFGAVYKGKLPGGQEVAVKRLSSVSVQGLEEFRNEVMSIAKLQHRNLVRLLGYCMKGSEKILVYEYMPNKSLNLYHFLRNFKTSWLQRLLTLFRNN